MPQMCPDMLDLITPRSILLPIHTVRSHLRYALETELAHLRTGLEQIRAKQPAKPNHSPLSA